MENSKMQNIISKMKENNDSPLNCEKRFMHVVKDLISFLKSVNEFLRAMSSDGQYPVNPTMFVLTSGVVSNFNESQIKNVVDVFSDRAIPMAEEIKSRNVDNFIESAHSIFEGIPNDIIDIIIKLVKNKTIPQDSIDDTFNFIDSLMRISIKRKCYLNDENEDLESAIELYF